MRVLLIEDDELLASGTQVGLRQRDFNVDWVSTQSAADSALRAEAFDCVLLDIGLPDESGLDLLRAVRDRGDVVPILMLTARDTPIDKVAGLDSGADDYVTKPFDLDELCARIRALQRRSIGRTTPQIELRDLRLDPAARTVTLAGSSLHLPPKEFELLHILLEHAGRTVARQRLVSRLYDWAGEAESNSIDVYIHNLRKKLGRSLIKTVWGVGYQID